VDNFLKRPSRPIITIILTVIYILIIMCPPAPLALISPEVAHALTGECSGNCDICGCSAEKQANHTCCCWMKKLKHQHDHENVPDCCKKKKRHKMTMLSCNCPCGDNKLPALPGAEKTEIMPYRFTEGVVALYEDTLFSYHKKRLTDRRGDPPDPPPKVALLS
jgi:hypothetical protein